MPTFAASSGVQKSLSRLVVAMALQASVLLAGVSMPLQSAETSPDTLDQAFEHPAADGLMVHRLAPGGQGQSIGLQPTDIIVSYAGHALTTVADLKVLVAQQLPPPLSIEIMRGTTRLTLAIHPGILGCYLYAVHQGVDSTLRAPRTVPLPPATPFSMDLSMLLSKPRETWYAFHFGDKDAQMGYEHYYLAVDHGQLQAVYDFAFDSHQFPIIASYERSTFELPAGSTTVVGIPSLLSTVFDGHDVHDHGQGRRERTGAGGFIWTSEEAVWRDDSWVTEHKSHPVPVVPLAAALQMHLGGFLAHTVGACVHYSQWQQDEPSVHAVRVMREETLVLPDQRHLHAWVVQSFSDRGPGLVSWFGDDGVMLKTDFGKAYGGAWSILTSRKQALQGLTPSIRVRHAADPLSPTPEPGHTSSQAGSAAGGF